MEHIILLTTLSLAFSHLPYVPFFNSKCIKETPKLSSPEYLRSRLLACGQLGSRKLLQEILAGLDVLTSTLACLLPGPGRFKGWARLRLSTSVPDGQGGAKAIGLRTWWLGAPDVSVPGNKAPGPYNLTSEVTYRYFLWTLLAEAGTSHLDSRRDT